MPLFSGIANSRDSPAALAGRASQHGPLPQERDIPVLERIWHPLWVARLQSEGCSPRIA